MCSSKFLLEGGSNIIAKDSLQLFNLTQFKSLIALLDFNALVRISIHLSEEPFAVSIINLFPSFEK